MLEPRTPRNRPRAETYWRIARWSAALALLLTPLVMMQISDEWHWTPAGFALVGGVLGGIGLVYELAVWATPSRPYRAGVALALVTSVLTVWTTIVRDDGSAIGFFFVVLAAGVGGFSALFRPAGLARTMLGVALMQALLGLAIATAPSRVTTPDTTSRTLLFCAVFVLLWLAAAGCFAAAARRTRSAVPGADMARERAL